MKDKILLLTIFISFLTLSSCGWNNKELTAEEKYAVDTIYNRQMHTLRAETDSICTLMKDTFYTQAVDSLKKEYLKEIELMLNTKLGE